jgi:hypothetical protein
MAHTNQKRLDRNNYTLETALAEIAAAEAILDGMGARQGLTLWGRIADVKEHAKPVQSSGWPIPSQKEM